MEAPLPDSERRHPSSSCQPGCTRHKRRVPLSSSPPIGLLIADSSNRTQGDATSASKCRQRMAKQIPLHNDLASSEDELPAPPELPEAAQSIPRRMPSSGAVRGETNCYSNGSEDDNELASSQLILESAKRNSTGRMMKRKRADAGVSPLRSARPSKSMKRYTRQFEQEPLGKSDPVEGNRNLNPRSGRLASTKHGSYILEKKALEQTSFISDQTLKRSTRHKNLSIVEDLQGSATRAAKSPRNSGVDHVNDEPVLRISSLGARATTKKSEKVRLTTSPDTVFGSPGKFPRSSDDHSQHQMPETNKSAERDPYAVNSDAIPHDGGFCSSSDSETNSIDGEHFGSGNSLPETSESDHQESGDSQQCDAPHDLASNAVQALPMNSYAEVVIEGSRDSGYTSDQGSGTRLAANDTFQRDASGSETHNILNVQNNISKLYAKEQFGSDENNIFVSDRALRDSEAGFSSECEATDNDLENKQSSSLRVRKRPPIAVVTNSTSRPFTGRELDHITDEIERYRENNRMTSEQIVRLLHEPVAMNAQPLWKKICHAAPSHTPSEIRRLCRQRWQVFEKTAEWAAEDDAKLEAAYREHRLTREKWEAIGTALGKRKEDCRRRWRRFVQDADIKRSRGWNEEEEKMLSKIVEQLVKRIIEEKSRLDAESPEYAQVDNFDPHAYLNWAEVSKQMGGTRSRRQCERRFYRLKKKSAQTSNQHRGPNESQDHTVLPTGDVEEERRQEKKARQTRRMSDYRRRLAEKSFDNMLVGDYYQVLREVMHTRPADAQHVRWHSIRNLHPNSDFPEMSKKLALEKMLSYVDEGATFMETLGAVKEYMESKYEGTLQMRFKPAKKLADEGVPMRQILNELNKDFVLF